MNRFFWVSAIALMLAACGDDDNSAVPSAKKKIPSGNAGTEFTF